MQKEVRALLGSIRSRRGLYWGHGRHALTCLVAFLEGYRYGYLLAGSDNPRPEELVPEGFTAFVARRLGMGAPGARAWCVLLEEVCTSEEEAFERFFQLRDAYESSQSVE